MASRPNPLSRFSWARGTVVIEGSAPSALVAQPTWYQTTAGVLGRGAVSATPRARLTDEPSGGGRRAIVDVDGVRLWLVVASEAEVGPAVRELQRRVKADRETTVPAAIRAVASAPAVDAVVDTSSSRDALPADAFIDQRSNRIDKAVYLRMAREKAFPSSKRGKRVIARWGDVQAALAPKPDSRAPAKTRADGDELDEVRRRLGLETRGEKKGK